MPGSPSSGVPAAVTTAIGATPNFTNPSIVAGRPVLMNANQVGTIPAVQGLSVYEYGLGILRQTLVSLEAVSIAMTDNTTAGANGSQKIYDFPTGQIRLLGVTADLTTLAGSGGLADTAALVSGVGSTAAANDNGTLTTTEVDMGTSTAGTLAAGAGTMKIKSAATAVFDGTGTALDAFLNFAVPDAGTSSNDTLTVTGLVLITWIHLGDN